MNINASVIDNKIKKLRCYKVYDYSIFSDDLEKDRDNIAVKMNRIIKKNELVKIGKSKFYKRPKGIINKSAHEYYNNPKDRSALRYESIKPNKYLMFKNLFWSNRNVPIALDKYISRILSEDVIGYMSYLRLIFGDRKVIEVYLENFYPSNRMIHIERALNV